MPVARTSTRVAAGAATVMMLFTGPLAVSPAFAQPSSQPSGAQPNSVPPPLEPGLINRVIAESAPKPDGNYKQASGCIKSNTGNAVIPTKPPAQLQLRLDEAHRFATGKDVKIAIIDTGTRPHARFGGRVEAGGDYVATGPGKDGTEDCDGHGTEVAGIAAAGADSNTNFIGAAPDARILAIRTNSDKYKLDGTTGSTTGAGNVKTLAYAIVQAVQRSAKVINISLTNCRQAGEPPSPNEKLLQAAIHWAVNEKNVVIVTAAGNIDDKGCKAQNDGDDPSNVNVIASPPWYADDVLSVASINPVGQPSTFSVWGPWVSVAAPGEGIITLDPGQGGVGLANTAVDERGASTPLQGTSFASPYVAGVVALVRERFPHLSAHQVMDRIKATAQHPGNVDGRDRKVGAGMINPVAALTTVLPAEEPGAKAPELKPVMTNLAPTNPKDMTPLIVALSGTGAGVGLLLLTLFVMHTINRNKGRRA
jgi:membrane-anchored mycosin MYCP